MNLLKKVLTFVIYCFFPVFRNIADSNEKFLVEFILKYEIRSRLHPHYSLLVPRLSILYINPLSANPTKWSNNLTILWGWRLKC